MKKRLRIIALFMLFSTLVNAQSETDFSIEQAIEYALSNNEKIKNANLDILAAEKKIKETTGIGLPQIDLEGKFQNFLDIPVSLIDAQAFDPNAPAGTFTALKFGQDYSTSATLNVNQLLFDGSYIVALKFSKFYKSMSETALERSSQEIKAQVRDAYFTTLIAQKNVELLDSVATTTKTLWDQARVYYETGFTLKEELDQLEIAFNRIEQNQKNAKNQLNIAKNFLKMQLGLPLDTEINLTENFDEVIAGIEENNPALKSFSLENNIDYIMLNQQKTLNEFSLKNEKAKYMPTAFAFLSHSQNAFRNEFDFFQDKPWYPTTVWGVGLNIPITSSGQRMMRVQQAEIKIEQDDNNINLMERSLKFQELQLKAMFLNAYEVMHIEEKNVGLANNIYKKSLARKKEGAVTALEVTQKQSQLLEAEGNYINAIMQMLNYKIALDKLYNN